MVIAQRMQTEGVWSQSDLAANFTAMEPQNASERIR